MRQVMYAMRFSGQARPTHEGSSVWRARTTSPSCRITTIIGDTALDGRIETVAGDHATFESEVTFTGPTTFSEAGTISFGEGEHTLRFTTVGQGTLGPSPQPNISHGAVIWRVEDGAGQFAGVTGLITSNFTVGADGEVVDHHFGVLYLPS